MRKTASENKRSVRAKLQEGGAFPEVMARSSEISAFRTLLLWITMSAVISDATATVVLSSEEPWKSIPAPASAEGSRSVPAIVNLAASTGVEDSQFSSELDSTTVLSSRHSSPSSTAPFSIPQAKDNTTVNSNNSLTSISTKSNATSTASSSLPSSTSPNSAFSYTVDKPPGTFHLIDSNTSSNRTTQDVRHSIVPNSSTEPYDLTRGPLACADVWPYLQRKDKGRCTYLQGQGGGLPEVRCELIGGYHPIAGSYTTLIHNAATYQMADERVGNGSAAGEGGLWCAYQTRFEMRKVDALPEGVSIRPDEALLEIARSERGPNGEEGETMLALVSQGFKSISLEMRPDGIGAKGAVRVDANCTTCEPEVWVIAYTKKLGVVSLYFNRAWRITMEFNPAYMSLATFMLRYLKEGALVEVIKIRGGERWGDTEIIPVPLLHLRTLDLKGNGLSSLTEINFRRMPNLAHLDLSNNNFPTLPTGISFLLSLRTLDLSNNPIRMAHFPPILQMFLHLEVLNLSGVHMETLDPLGSNGGIINLGTQHSNDTVYAQLKELYLNNCNLTDVDTPQSRTFLSQLHTLRVLHLSGNPLSEVPNDLAERLPALQELHLSGCRLSSPPALRLAPAQRLLRLDLSRNLLATPEGALAPLAAGGGVALLDVSVNPLRGAWGERAFAPLGPGAALNLSRTELSVVTRSMLEALRPLRAVDLGGNPFDCSKCSIHELQHWLKNISHPEILRPPLCVLPPSERGRPVREASGPPPEQCAPPPTPGGWSGVAVAGAVAAGALLAAGALALLSFRFRLELTYVLHVLRANRAVKGLSAADAECDFDAFVCYSKYDRSWVLGELLQRLEGDNPRYRLCLHERDFPLGSLIVQNIVECMARSRRTLMILTKAFVDSQWCQWELEMATHRLLEGAGRDFLVLVELEPLEARALPRLLRLLVETRTFLQWPSALVRGCAPGGGVGCCGGGAEAAEEAAWKRLREALGPPLRRSSKRCHTTSPSSAPDINPVVTPPKGDFLPSAGDTSLKII